MINKEEIKIQIEVEKLRIKMINDLLKIIFTK